jgi:cytochrome c oxidase subunit 3
LALIKIKMKASSNSTMKHFPYHLVTPSPWPALTSFGMLTLTIGIVLTFHKYSGGVAVFLTGLCTLIFVSSSWWRDIYRESAQGCHTNKVKAGLHLGLLLFIVTELMFFVGLLWASMHAALMPTVQIGQAWPPVGIVPVDWTRRPLLNSVVLATSFFSANAAKHALDSGDHKRAWLNLVITIVLGLTFVGFQYLEYTDAPFTFSDSMFGSTFYLTTGFHGLITWPLLITNIKV